MTLMRMSNPIGLDPDLLRAFVYIAEDGSFTRAAERVGRTQSAVSMQVQRLESLLGEKILTRGKGGAVQLTAHGRYLLDKAREVLALNDAIWSAFHEPLVHGTVRLGTPDDYAMRFLPPVLKRFAQTHPAVEVDVLCLPSSNLIERLKAGDLDLTLCSEGQEPRNWPSTRLWSGPLQWITSDRHAPHRLDPLPLALSAGDCAWRRATLRTLDKSGRRYRVAYTSATLTGSHVPVSAGRVTGAASGRGHAGPAGGCHSAPERPQACPAADRCPGHAYRRDVPARSRHGGADCGVAPFAIAGSGCPARPRVEPNPANSYQRPDVMTLFRPGGGRPVPACPVAEPFGHHDGGDGGSPVLHRNREPAIDWDRCPGHEVRRLARQERSGSRHVVWCAPAALWRALL